MLHCAIRSPVLQNQPLTTLSDYEALPDAELVERIRREKERRGSSVVILGHHYQRPQIVKLSDFVGDSFGLSQQASKSQARDIVFCGVRFMAESAAILSQPEQRVYHPDPDAGCPMADMANMEQVNQAWATLTKWFEKSTSRARSSSVESALTPLVPVTYMNSTADLKSFCGEQGGTICTSSNAAATFTWAYNRGHRIFFFPDQHLGRNTARNMNIPDDEIILWDPLKPDGGLTAEQAVNASVILWAGHCPVHAKFNARDIRHVRKYFPGCKVVVHPECDRETVEAADAAGSTEFIRKYVADAPKGSTIFIGTEVNMVTRLAEQYKGEKRIFRLSRSLCLTMYQISLANLAYTLEHLEELETVVVPDEVKHNSRVALDRMLSIH